LQSFHKQDRLKQEAKSIKGLNPIKQKADINEVQPNMNEP